MSNFREYLVAETAMIDNDICVAYIVNINNERT